MKSQQLSGTLKISGSQDWYSHEEP